ncbi:MAG: hypothetical protein Kow00108_16910 [Calditrichia bacterium]
MKSIGVCGCICNNCELYSTECKGCHEIKGKPSWLSEVGLNICDFYDCAVNKKQLTHCGMCHEIPCAKFWQNKSPDWLEEEHRLLVRQRVELLKKLAKS